MCPLFLPTRLLNHLLQLSQLLHGKLRDCPFNLGESTHPPGQYFPSAPLTRPALGRWSKWVAGSNQVTDHYLAALSRQHGLALATFEEALSRAFPDEPNLVDPVP